MARVQPVPAPAGSPHWELTVFGAWRLLRGRTEVYLHRREQRLLTLLAVQGGRPRGYLAGVLWPESTEHHAAGNLRAAVWGVDRAAPGLLSHDRSGVRIAASLRVDVDAFVRCAFRILAWRDDTAAADRAVCSKSLPVLLSGDLLPGWYEDWVVHERTRLDQLRLRALQVLAELLTDFGDVSDALVAASAGVAIEPLYEPAIRALVRAEIENGDDSGALREYETYRSRLLSELGVPPSSRLEGLVRPLLNRRGRSVVA